MDARPASRLGRAGRALALLLAASMLPVPVQGSGGSRGISEPFDADRAANHELRLAWLNKGDHVLFAMKDGTVRAGIFQRIGHLDDSLYAERFARVRATCLDSTALPAPGSRITVQKERHQPRDARLEGYGFRSLELTWEGKSKPSTLAFGDFQSIADTSGHTWTSDSLTEEAEAGRVPAREVLELKNSSGLIQVPVDQVETVAWQDRGRNAVEGLVVMAGIVAVLLVVSYAIAVHQYGGIWIGY